MASRGRLLRLLKKKVQLQKNLWEKDTTSHLVNDISKHFPDEFMDSNTSLKF